MKIILTSQMRRRRLLIYWNGRPVCPAGSATPLRRLCAHPRLTPSDIIALVAVCKGEAPATPLDANHIRDTAASHAVVSLDTLRDEAHLANVTIHHERGDQAKWLREVTAFQDQIRASWERAMEEAVGPVIRRLSRKVDTTGLNKLIITDADCTAMREAFGRCSALLHSQPGEINPRLPAPTAIESEIKALASWIADIWARQEKVA
jgi:hypothetical protein